MPATSAQSVRFSIPAQPLASALDAFSRASGWQVGYSSQIVRGRTSQPVLGAMAPAQALRTLLSGSGIELRLTGPAIAALVASSNEAALSADDSGLAADGTTVLETIVVSAGEQLTQAPGVSIITAEDIQRLPPTNDIAEIVRTMPGVNLTGNNSTGQRGNQRQIDIRGMGPENTLILIDGKPVMSRNSVRYGMAGDRDTRGDSNWVPPEAIESIEVLRGPAAARYGSGAAGGVVNIKTKAASEQTVSIGTYLNVPEDSREGITRRANVLASGPINDILSYRVYGSYNLTDNDEPGLNGPSTATSGGYGGGTSMTSPAGREGVENTDLGARFTLQPTGDHRVEFDAAWSRQGNRYAGDTLIGTTSATSPLLDLAGSETNRMTRTALSLSHYGTYDFGTSESYVQWENTKNERLAEGLDGPTEGVISTTGGGEWNTATLNAFSGKSQFDIPLSLGYEQMLTVGADFRYETLDDPGSIASGRLLPTDLDLGIPSNAADRSTRSSAYLLGLFLEDNIYVGERLTLTPGVRMDYHEEFGANPSPSLNASYQLTEQFTLKAGIARAFKAPNLYQLNPNYLYYSAGLGCWGAGFMPCYILGNSDLDPEISINKEIGIAYRDDAGWAAGITYFHNDYDNRIVAGRTIIDSTQSAPPGFGGSTSADIFQWENSGPATIEGFEGNVTMPLAETLTLSSNFTYMLRSEDDQGEPLSLVPKYTINAQLDWKATEKLALNLGVTHYGETKARTTNLLKGVGTPVTGTESRDAYTLVNIGMNYNINDNFRLNAGVKNLFDKQLFRTGDGANTYNEPGRSYYLGLNATF